MLQSKLPLNRLQQSGRAGLNWGWKVGGRRCGRIDFLAAKQQLLRRDNRHRTAEQVPLGKWYLQPGQGLAFAFAFDPFGDELAANLAREADQRLRQRAAGRVDIDMTRQAHIEFENIGLKVDDMAQPGIARTDIVDRNLRMGAQWLQ